MEEEVSWMLGLAPARTATAARGRRAQATALGSDSSSDESSASPARGFSRCRPETCPFIPVALTTFAATHAQALPLLFFFNAGSTRHRRRPGRSGWCL